MSTGQDLWRLSFFDKRLLVYDLHQGKFVYHYFGISMANDKYYVLGMNEQSIIFHGQFVVEKLFRTINCRMLLLGLASCSVSGTP